MYGYGYGHGYGHYDDLERGYPGTRYKIGSLATFLGSLLFVFLGMNMTSPLLTMVFFAIAVVCLIASIALGIVGMYKNAQYFKQRRELRDKEKETQISKNQAQTKFYETYNNNTITPISPITTTINPNSASIPSYTPSTVPAYTPSTVPSYTPSSVQSYGTAGIPTIPRQSMTPTQYTSGTPPLSYGPASTSVTPYSSTIPVKSEPKTGSLSSLESNNSVGNSVGINNNI